MVANCWREKLSPEEAEVEYAKSERGLRFQLIEGRAMAQSDIKITFEDLKAFTTKKYPSTNGTIRTNKLDEEVQGIVARVLSNQDEVKKLSDQVVLREIV
jgi:trigger factor